jgi:hypothetical protein
MKTLALLIVGSIASCAPSQYPQNGYYGARTGYPKYTGTSSGIYTGVGTSSSDSRATGYGTNSYSPNSLSNPYGAGSPYKSDGLMNPYSRYGSEYSNESWKNPYATNAPKLYDSDGNYRGRLSSNPYDADSTSNPYGRYGSEYSSDSINNPYGAGNPYSSSEIYVVPQD